MKRGFPVLFLSMGSFGKMVEDVRCAVRAAYQRRNVRSAFGLNIAVGSFGNFRIRSAVAAVYDRRPACLRSQLLKSAIQTGWVRFVIFPRAPCAVPSPIGRQRGEAEKERRE